MESKRLYGIDLIKTVAIFFVISVHFFLNSGYYNTVMSGKTMLIMTALRWLFFTCVPLFLLSTGFLRIRKKMTKKYYLSLITVYISYIIAATLSSIFKYRFINDTSDGVFFELMSILSFKNGYSWYMEMFFGVALLIPFLNLAYNAVETKAKKAFLICLMLFMTGVCSLDLKLTFSDRTYFLFTDYWVILYPFTYYLLGAYIEEYRPRINKFLGTFALIAVICAEAFYTYFRCRGEFFRWSLLGGYGGITVTVSSVILFLLLYDIKIENKFLKRIFKSISAKTLDIYMISYLADLAVYSILKKIAPDFLSGIKLAPIAVITVFVCGYIYASAKTVIFDVVALIWKKIYSERLTEDRDEAASANLQN